jgi:hypothetical protein
MDKSFNDDELSDIMKEIEALEEDFSASDDKAATPVMEELAHMEEEFSIPQATSNIVAIDSKRAATKSHSENSTSMSFKVQGNLTLELKFEIGGKEVSLEVTESGLAIEMEGGAKFSVPIHEKTSLKKAV